MMLLWIISTWMIGTLILMDLLHARTKRASIYVVLLMLLALVLVALE